MEIELAEKTIGKIRKKQQLKLLFSRILIWGGLVLGIVLIATALFNFLVVRNNRELDGKIKLIQKEIESKSKVETQQVYLLSKLDSFGGLLTTHELHQSVAETVFSLIPSGTSLKDFSVAETGGIALSGSVPDWQLLNRFFTNLKQPPTAPLKVKSYKIKQISFSSTGGINFDVELALDVPKSSL